jgi:hypothetical protein
MAMNGSKFETNIENGEARMTRKAESLCHVHPMSGGLGSRSLKDDGWEAVIP